MRNRRFRAALLSAALLAGAMAPAAPGAASPVCRQALALALDVSGSVDRDEYLIQRQGLARALLHPEVAEALLALPGTAVDLMVYEWSDDGQTRVIAPWTSIDDAVTLTDFATRVADAPRGRLAPATALGSAMRAGLGHLAARGHCWKRTLDISGDGTSNSGPLPGPVRIEAEAQGVTINALVIGGDADNLPGYFRAYVIAGPGAFVETAHGFSSYEAAMVRKLKRELEGLIVSLR